METMAKVRKVGGSLTVTIPKEITEKLHLKEHETISVDVKRPEKSFFGTLKNLTPFEEADRFDRE